MYPNMNLGDNMAGSELEVVGLGFGGGGRGEI